MACNLQRYFLKKDSASLEPAEKVHTFWTLLGVLLRSLIGVAVFSLHGEIVKSVVGPAILVSYVIVGLIMLIAGLNLAEFASHSERSGSIYQQTYMEMGEFWAVVIGWLMVGAYCLETAIIAKIFSGYIDALAQHQIRKKLTDVLPISGFLDTYYPDFVGCAAIVIFAAILALGFQKTLALKTLSTFGTIMICLHFVITGFTQIDQQNWEISFESLVEADLVVGEGGFSPYMSLSVVRGAAFCVYSFAGISVLSTTVAQTYRPVSATILTLILAVVFNILILAGTSAVLTLMTPYYDQEDIAVFSHALRDMTVISIFQDIIISMLALFRLAVVLQNSGLLIASMADDGLVFVGISKEFGEEKCPKFAITLASVLASLMCIFLKIFHLFQTMALVLLLTYTLVAIFTIKLRYKYVTTDENVFRGLRAAIFRRISSEDDFRRLSSGIVWSTTFFYLIWCVLFSLLVFYCYDDIVERNTMGIFLILLAIVFLIISFVLMQMHPQKQEETSFQLRLSPLWPCLSILLNVMLLTFFGWAVWVAVGLWMVLGLATYFGYGVKHSKIAVKN